MKLSRTAKAIAARAVLGSPGYWEAARRHRAMAVLCYHRVSEGPDPLDLAVRPEEFAAQMEALAGSRDVSAVDAGRFEAIWRGEESYGNRVPVLVTFDDGYRDNLLQASPILRGVGIPALLFVATGVLESEPLWYDLLERALDQRPRETLEALNGLAARGRLEAPPGTGLRPWVDCVKRVDDAEMSAFRSLLKDLCPGWTGVEQYLSAADLGVWIDHGHAVGAHTRLHPCLARVDDEHALAEMAVSKQALERIVGGSVRFFAYPFGGTADFDHRHPSMLAGLGYTMAFTTIPGLNRAGDPPLSVRRKCVSAGLFARPGARFDPTLFVADTMAMGPELRRSLARLMMKLSAS